MYKTILLVFNKCLRIEQPVIAIVIICNYSVVVFVKIFYSTLKHFIPIKKRDANYAMLFVIPTLLKRPFI